MSSLYGNVSRSCDVPVQSSVSADDAAAAADQHRPRVSRDLRSSNDNSPSEINLPSHPVAPSRLQSDTESQANMAGASGQPRQSDLHTSVSALHGSSLNDLLSQLHIRLAPLSDFLTQHLTVLQTWLSCASYGQLVLVLCQHIAEVNCVV